MADRHAAQEERRRHPRLACEGLVSFTAFGRSAGLGDIRDVSLGGMRFTAVGCSFDPDELVTVSFNIGERTIDAVGRVARVRSLDAISVEVGLAFVRVDPWAARLLEDEAAEREGAAQTENRSS